MASQIMAITLLPSRMLICNFSIVLFWNNSMPCCYMPCSCRCFICLRIVCNIILL